MSDIPQTTISELGQSQADRAAPELESGFVRVDERTSAEHLRFAQGFAELVKFPFYDSQHKEIRFKKAWKQFFTLAGKEPAELLAANDGTTPPQLALFLAFLQLFERERAALNRFTDQHLDFYFRRVLQFVPRPGVPDHAHVVFELKKNAPRLRVLPEHELSAGKDAIGVERIYRPVRESVIGAARVDGLRTLFADRAAGTLRSARKADSADGLGAPLPEADPSFPPFGHPTLPETQVGFAVGSPVLRMREGTRKVTLSLRITAASSQAVPASASLAASLEAFITGEKGWLGPYSITGIPDGPRVNLTFEVPAGAAAVVDHAAAIHGTTFAAAAPVAQLLVKAGTTSAPALGWGDLAARGLELAAAQVLVDVSGLTTLVLQSDAGTFEPKKPVMPFGPQPVVGGRFLVGCAEALSKRITKLELAGQWLGLPPTEFTAHYHHYGPTVQRGTFTVHTSYVDGGGGEHKLTEKRLFQGSGAALSLDLGPSSPSSGKAELSREQRIRALEHAGSAVATAAAAGLRMAGPVRTAVQEAAGGFITITLDRDFLHDVYRRRTMQIALGQEKEEGQAIVLNEPYTPLLRDLTLRYAAHSPDVAIGSGEVSDDVLLFHVDAFGQRREHAWLRNQLPWVPQKSVPLLPPHSDEGALLIGVSGAAAGDSLNLLLQVAEGSADPDERPPPIRWWVLCDNHWREFDSSEIPVDTTNQLRRSGLISFLLPRETTTDNSLLPPAHVWLRATIAEKATATSRLIAVLANAVEVAFVDRGNDPHHLDLVLPARSIVKLKTPLAPVKSVAQPYASFDGRAVESEAALITRASERLRHKDRCITPWDYERVVLEAFPRVHKVKCIPHAKPEGRWQAPGNVLLVVVPDLRNRNARNPLEPRADADTLSAIEKHTQARAGMQVTIRARNPAYQKIRLKFSVKLHRGFEPNLYHQILRQEVTAFLSPFAFDAERSISFGGRVYRSVILNFVEERPYVDYVTDFQMFSFLEGAPPGPDLAEARPERPDAILVSDAADAHDVSVIPP